MYAKMTPSLTGVRRGVRDIVGAVSSKVLHSIILAAMARLWLLIGMPAVLGLSGWVLVETLAQKQLAAVQAAEQARLVVEMRDMQDYRREAFAREQVVTNKLATVQDALADQKRTLERIDDRLAKR